MTPVTGVIVILGAALAGVGLARLIRLPGATLLGALAGASLAKLLFPSTSLPDALGLLMQVLIGAAIGVRLGPAVVRDARRWAPAFSVALVAVLTTAAAGAWILTTATGTSWRTSALAVLPGGAADATALAIAADQQGATVAAIHLTRQLLVLLVVATALRWWTDRERLSTRGLGEPRRTAGAVVWRHLDDRLEILLVHRPRYDDWSLPKGGIEPHETAPDAAVREALEETGWSGVAGPEIATSHVRERRGPHGSKVVTFFMVEAVQDRGFVPSDEVDAVRWYPIDEADVRCSRPQDRDVLSSFRWRWHADQDEGRRR